MLFEEWTQGTGLEDHDEYQLAERLYATVMPDDFSKQDLYKLRASMSKAHFIHLCNVALKTLDWIDRLQDELVGLQNYKSLMDEVTDTLKNECNIDTIDVFTKYKAEKARQAEADRVRQLYAGLENH